PEPLQDELPDLGGRRRLHPRRPGAQFVDLEGRQPSCSTLQVEQDERLDAAFLEFLDPDADGRIVDEQRLGNRGEGPASVEQQNGVRPAGDAIIRSNDFRKNEESRYSGEPFYEIMKAEMPTKLLRSFTGSQFTFE